MRRNTSLRYPGGPKTAWGVLAYVAGYLLTYVLARSRFASVLDGVVVTTENGPQSVAALAGETVIPTWVGAGWLFYNAHLVPITVPRPFQPPILENLVTAAGGPVLGLLVIPPLVLVLAGVVVTRTAETATALRFDLVGRPWLRYGLNGGLITTLGYLPFALVGAVLFAVSADVRIAPDLTLGWALVGMGYPLVFGGIGGILAYRWRYADVGW